MSPGATVPADLLGKSFDVAFPELIATALGAALRQVMHEHTPLQLEYYYPDQNRWFESRIYPTPEGIAFFAADITARKQAERNAAFLADVSAQLIQLDDDDETMRVMAELIGSYFGVDHCTFIEFNMIANTVLVLHDWRKSPGNHALTGVYQLADFVTDAFGQALRAGESVAVHDIASDPRTAAARANFEALGLASFVNTPHVSNGLLRAAVAIFRARPTLWRNDEIVLLRELTSRVWAWIDRVRAEARRRAAEEQYRTLTELSAQMIWVLDPLGSITYLNTRWYDYTGLSWDEVQAHGWMPVLHPDERSAISDTFAQNIAQGEPYEMELRLRSADGSYRWHLTRAVPLRDEDEAITQWLGVTVDIDERKAVEEALRLREADSRFLADLAECIRLAETPSALLRTAVRMIGVHLGAERCYFAEIDEAADQFTIHYEYHDAAPPLAGTYRISDYPADAVRRMRAGNVVVVDDAAQDPSSATIFMRAYAPYGLRARVVVPFRSDGQWVSNLVTATAAPRRWTEREVALLETVAERVWVAAEKLRAQQELRAYAARLLASNAEAQAAVRIRDQFLTVAAHELKTPLTALLGYSQTLLRRIEREQSLPERDRRLLQQTNEQALRLNRLIDALLDVGRIESGRLSIERVPLDLSALLTRIADAMAPTLERHSLQVSGVEETIVISGDELRLEQVIHNLVSNAVKYSPQGGTVFLTLSVQDGLAQLVVRDQGIGIPAAALPQLFQRFFRVDGDNTRHIAGMGIGLYVIKEIVELHGGTVAVESAEGVGSSFIVSLPLATGDAGAPPLL
jgi:PAS domain S-box-containing protein